MKRPRRPAKRVASKKTKPVKRKTSKIVRGLKQALAHAREAPDWAPDDERVFDIPKPPAGFAYQWSPFSRIEYMRSRGWSQVPFSRHPEMLQSTNFDGYIVYRDTALFQISAGLAEAERRRLTEIAKDMTRDFEAMYEIDSIESGSARGLFRILSPSFMVSQEYAGYSGPPVDVQLTITLRMPERWCDTASSLQLDYAEYARRRVLMCGHLLAADEATGIFSPFELTTKKVEV